MEFRIVVFANNNLGVRVFHQLTLFEFGNSVKHMGSSVRIVDGSFDWSAGINSSGTTSAQSPVNPNGVPRNMLVWLVNGTVRGGAITPRPGWQPITTIHDGSALYQGGIMYYPPGDSFPYLVLSI